MFRLELKRRSAHGNLQGNKALQEIECALSAVNLLAAQDPLAGARSDESECGRRRRDRRTPDPENGWIDRFAE
jgi:hypothetical protein